MRIIKLLTLGFIFSQYAFGSTVETLKVNLNDILKNIDIKTSDIYAISAIAVGQDNSKEDSLWKYGIWGKIKRGYLWIKPEGVQSRNLSKNLQILYNAGTVENIKSCDTQKKCENLNFEKKNKQYIFNFEGNTWSLKLHANPCVDNLNSCQILVTSWYLTKILESSNFQSFPSALAIIAHTKGITFVDATRKMIWFNILNSDISSLNLGNFVSSTYIGEGKISLKFDRGFLVLDFKYDRAFKINSDGIFGSNSSLTALEDGFSPLWENTHNSRPIAIISNVIIFEDLYKFINFENLSFNADEYKFQYGFKVLDVSFDKEHLYILLNQNKNILHLDKINFNTKNYQNIFSLNLTEDLILSNFKLINDSLYYLSNKNVDLILSNNNKLKTSLSAIGADNIIFKANVVLAKFNSSNVDQCELKVYFKHKNKSDSFSFGQLNNKCGLYDISYSLHNVIILSVINKNILYLKYSYMD